jgi:hypothetical protein
MAGIGKRDWLDTRGSGRTAEDPSKLRLVLGERVETKFDSQIVVPCQHRRRRRGIRLYQGVEAFGQPRVAVVEIHS